MNASRSFSLLLIVFPVAVTTFSLLFMHHSRLQVTDIEYRIEGQTAWQAGDMPLSIDTNNTPTQVKFGLNILNDSQKNIQFQSHQCVNSVHVNGQAVQGIDQVACTTRTRLLHLSPYLENGPNQIIVVVKPIRRNAVLSVHLSKLNPLRIIPILGIVATLILTGLLFIKKRHTTSLVKTVTGIIILGIVLRIIYVYGTPYNVRAHDVQGHIGYINAMAESFGLPKAGEGWANHHTPLYYAITSVWIRIGRVLSLPYGEVLGLMQIQALISSVITLLIGMKIGEMLIDRKKNLRSLVLFWTALVTMPGLIYFAARINNDTLVQIWMFLCLLYMLHWWQKGDIRYWYVTLAILLIGFLSKITCLILLPVMICCMLVHRDTSRKQKWTTIGITALIAILSTGWFFYQRLVVEEADYMIIGNRINGKLWANNSLKGALMLNPIRFVQEPFNDLRKDETRQYFWEYYIRSMFFGESRYNPALNFLGSAIMLFVIILIPIMLYGLLRDVRKDWYVHFPMLMVLFWLFAAQITRRTISPFSPSQDFRLTMLTIVPILFYLVCGIRYLPRHLRQIAETAVYSLSICSALFVLLVSLL